ncbi:MAG: YidC/Oxa1 family membrane protein insertase [Treponema sp.]|jgi:YidC/Oxa1 family membrane protein insertase|nr:YidC/Oxa1 family membrane protein insertase [Treponema sp.]
MLDILYTLTIFPLVQIIELCFFFVYRVAGRNPGAALFGVSLAVSVLTLPLYFRAEKWQEAEREIQKRMAAKIKRIKAVFSGDEQYMILSTYYRQNHYHPVYALRSSFSLLIQAPFFIAAYSYLSHLDVLQGTAFLFIPDLGAPDGLISIGGFGVNFLPIAMTLINCLSGTLYARGFPVKEKAQLYLMAVVFLVLLYPSPSGLVLYWTLNNLFSLAKNILVKTKFAKQAVFGILFTAAACLDIYVLFFHRGDPPNRLLACALFSLVFFIPLLAKLPALAAGALGARALIRDRISRHWCFLASSLILLVLTGLVIPGSLIASSVEEFSFIEAYASPFPFIFHVLLQASGFFIVWVPGLYFLFSGRIQKLLCLLTAVLSLGACVNVFLVSENFGFLTNTLIFSEPKSLSAGNPGAYAVNLAVLALVTAAAVYLILRGKRTALFSLQAIALLSLLGFGILNLAKIHGEFTALRDRRVEDAPEITGESPYRLSRQGKNVMLFMLDAAVSGYVPYIFEEKPELERSFKDFTWFPNCVSFANHTLAGAPPFYGGYEYTPEAINLRGSVPLAEKHKEAYLLLPRLFLDAGYTVTVTDPPFDNYTMSNLSVFSEYPEIRAENVSGKYTSLWLNDHPDIMGMNIGNLLKANLIRFSFFKTVPLFLRYFVYNDGNWMGTENLRGSRSSKNGLTYAIINDYALLDLLPRLTSVGGGGDTYTAVYGHLPHDTALFQLPDYVPSSTVNNREDGPGVNNKFANDGRYHVNMASFLLMGKFIEFLKAEGIYENTRIILAADHGRGAGGYEKDIPLPDGSTLQSYNPLLMFKDFGPEDGGPGKMAVDDSFMTNADTVFFALKDIIADPVNPFTNKKLEAGKAEGVKITTIGALSSYRHSKYRYQIRKGQWMGVHSNIFDPANWKPLEE